MEKREPKVVGINEVETMIAPSKVRVRRLITRKRVGSDQLMVGVCFMDPGEKSIIWSSEYDNVGVKTDEYYYGPMNEMYYIITGKIELYWSMRDDENKMKKKVLAREGDSVFLPPGLKYQITNSGTEPVMLVYATTPSLE